MDNANLSGADLSGAMNGANADATGAIWRNTTCPDTTNSDADHGTCIGHGF